ncbi:MAG: aspartate ammonia-lyase [Candidatus Eisenbacteria bacterium]|nr:aspartate ammonia-lyase [Candidatus Eisenbacteria bacterium]
MEEKKEFRIERDSLGEVEVPAGALYGAQTARAVRNFPVSGLRPWPAFIRSMAAIKGAAAEVNRDLGLLDGERAEAIAHAAREVMEGRWDDQFVVDPFQAGAGTSHNMNVNEVIANRAALLLGAGLGEYRVHPNDHVNMSQSTNDTVPAAIRIGCLLRLEELVGAGNDLAAALREKAEEFDDVVKSGRTHLQDAVPVRLGQEFGAYARAVERDGARIVAAAESLRRIGIGGTAAGSGLNAHAEYHERMVARLAEWTGLDLEGSDDLFESMQSMADGVHFSASLRTLALTLIRIANDLRLLASGPSTGLAEIRLPAVQPGSSIMPGKVNPVLAEMLDMAMFHVVGLDCAVALASQSGQLELNVMMPVIAHDLFEMMQVTIGAVRAFTDRCVRGIEADRERAAQWLDRNAIVVTALNPLIGYSRGAELVKEAAARGVTVREAALEAARAGSLARREGGRPVTEKEVERALGDLRRLTEGGLI